MSDVSDTCLGIACCDEPGYPVTPTPPYGEAATKYWNISQTVHCPTGTTGSSVTIAANSFSSEVSQDDANNQAIVAGLALLSCAIP